MADDAIVLKTKEEYLLFPAENNSILTLIFFSLLLGYGHLTPVTAYGKLFCIAFSLFGIPLCLLTLKSAGVWISEHLKRTIINFEIRVFKVPNVRLLEFKCAFLTLVLMVIFLSVSSAVQVIWEKWTFVDSFYTWFITFTTVGFGDYIPFESVVSREDGILAAIFHIFATFPALCGLCLVASVINTLLRVFDKQEESEVSNCCSGHSFNCTNRKVKDNQELKFVITGTAIEPLNEVKRSHSV